MRDVRERPAVHEGRHAFASLHQIRFQRIAQQREHRAGRLEFRRPHRHAFGGEAHDDAIEPRAQIAHRFAQAKNPHDLRRRGDVEAAATLAGFRVGVQHHVAQRAIVHVEHALPQHLCRRESRLFEVELIVDERREQIVRGSDRVEVAREMQVDIDGWLHRAAPAARSSALASEHRPHGWLPQRERGAPAELRETLRQSDRRHGLSLARRRRRDGRHEDEFAARRSARQRLECHLRLVSAEKQQMLLCDPNFPRDFRDILHGFLR